MLESVGTAKTAMRIWLFGALLFVGGLHPFASGAGLRYSIVEEKGFEEDVPEGPYESVRGIFVGVTTYARERYNGLVYPAEDARELARAPHAVDAVWKFFDPLNHPPRLSLGGRG